VQVGRLEKEAALAGPVVTLADDPLPVDEVPLLDERAVSGVHDGAGTKLIGRQEVGQDT
jgi:hypothetical protein